jgi:hypothetical protein
LGSGGAGLNSGAAGTYSSTNGTVNGGAGGTNTGGGGGGGGHQCNGGAGGSGIVIVRYYGSQQATGGTITSSGGYTIHTFTSSGTFTPTGFIGVKDMSSTPSNVTVKGPTWDPANGGSYVFSGTNPNAIIVTNQLLNLKTSQGGSGFTVIVWAKSTGGAGAWRKVIGYADGENYMDLYQSSATQGYWHQDGSGESLYVDGVAVNNDSYSMVNAGWHCYAATSSNAGTLTNPSTLLTIGNDPNLSSYPFIGNIAKVDLYNRVLTTDELLQHFYAFRGRFGV